MDVTEAQRILNSHGFPCGAVDGIAGATTKGALMRFQQAYNGPGGWLDTDGVLGPKTADALQWTQDNNALVSYFSVPEVACHHCGLAYVKRELLSALFKLREAHGPVTILDAYRCPAHNSSIGGAANSQHVLGLACDPVGISIAEVLPLKAFTGIGTPDHRRATHLDVRTNVSPVNPAIFFDASQG
jgi:zinc D-Ala-D-Ala carboxypeptidase